MADATTETGVPERDGQPFTFRGITEVCPTCEQGGIEHIAGGKSGA